MKRFFILWAALHVKIAHSLSKLPELILLVCSCSPAETQIVATLTPGAGVPCEPLGFIGSASSLEVSHVQERSTAFEGGWLGKARSLHH